MKKGITPNPRPMSSAFKVEWQVLQFLSFFISYLTSCGMSTRTSGALQDGAATSQGCRMGCKKDRTCCSAAEPLQWMVCVIRSLIDLIVQRHQHAPAVVSRLVRVVVVSGAIRSRCASMEATNDSHSSVSDMQMNVTQSTCLSAIRNFRFFR